MNRHYATNTQWSYRMLSVESMFGSLLLKWMNLWSDVGPEYVYKTFWKAMISLFRKKEKKGEKNNDPTENWRIVLSYFLVLFLTNFNNWFIVRDSDFYYS